MAHNLCRRDGEGVEEAWKRAHSLVDPWLDIERRQAGDENRTCLAAVAAGFSSLGEEK